MKKLIILILAIAPVLYFSACKKKYTTDSVTEKTVKPHYPTITLNGPQFISVPVGAGTYSDQGASGLDDNTNLTSGLTPEPYSVDLTTPGFYTVIYKFKNSDGYAADMTRFILVTDVSNTLDYSGEYVRTTGTPTNITKVAKGLYKTDNVGGVGANGVPNPAFLDDVYFGQIDDTTLVFPEQPTIFGTLYCVNSFIYAGASDTTLKYAVRNSAFGTQVRTFIKDDDGVK
jgi:Domain of unknown function (DUF5011)